MRIGASIIGLSSLLIAGAVYAASSVSSPTCTLTATPGSVDLLRTTPINFTWSSSGGDSASLKVDAFSQSNIYSTTGLSGNVTVPVRASLGLAATLTVTRNSPYGVATCKTMIPTVWTPVR